MISYSHFLERRRDPRTSSFTPISLCVEGRDDPTPAHLMDLSCGGAGIMTTAYNAPAMGEYLDVVFETPTNDGACEGETRRETAVVVNHGSPERGVVRLGLRFLERPDIGCDLFDPIDTLDSHCKAAQKNGLFTGRWDTARNFRKQEPVAAAAW